MPKSGTPEDWFFEKVDSSPGQGPQGDCHTWTGALDSDGYGVFMVKQVWKGAHAFAFFLEHGFYAKMCLHTCVGMRNCVNPSHLYSGNARDNASDKVNQGRSCVGNKHGAKLSITQVREIKKDLSAAPQGWYKRNQEIIRLASKYRVTQTSIANIDKGVTWKDV